MSVAASPRPSSLDRHGFEMLFERWFPRVAGWLDCRLPPDALEAAIRDVVVRGAVAFVPSSSLPEEERARLLLHHAREAVAERSASDRGANGALGAEPG